MEIDKELTDKLYNRISEEANRIIEAQLKLLGIKPEDKAEIRRVLYPDDPKILAVYYYNDIKLLAVKISENDMGIEFDIPIINLKQGENDNV